MRALLSILIATALSGCLFPNTYDLSGSAADAKAPSDATVDVGSDSGSGDASVDSDAALGSALVGEWRFDEGSGSIAKDTSGRGHDGTIASGTWISGRAGAAIQLSGAATSLVTVPASPDFDRPAGTTFTITAWVKFTGAISHHLFISINYGPSDSTYGIEAESPTIVTYWDGANHTAESTVTWDTNWHHTAVVVDGSKPARLFFDGAMVGAATGDTVARTCTSVSFGGGSYNDRMQGALDTVRFYRRALSDQEIVADMNQ